MTTLTEPAPERPRLRTGVLPVAVAGVGSALPERTVTNDDLSEFLDTSDEWISTRTGIRERRIADDDTATSDLATAAARQALEDAGLEPGDVKGVVVATTTPDHPIPATAPIVAANLRTAGPAFDLNAACSGFVYGLRVAGTMVAAGDGPMLLIGAETLSRAVDWTDRTTAVLFGDGAGAVVLTRDEDAALGPFDLGADGGGVEALYTPSGGSRDPADEQVVEERTNFLRMNGREVYRHAVAEMTRSSQEVLGQAGLEVDDVDLFVGHQANARILTAVAKRLEVDDERNVLTVEHHGNTSAASIPLALAELRDRLSPGDTVLLSAFGAGFTWGSCLLTWQREGDR